jgi:hypothetical protein
VALGSSEWKAKDAWVLLVRSGGVSVSTVSGAVDVAVTSQLKVAGVGLVLPARSVAVTLKVCVPTANPV